MAVVAAGGAGASRRAQPRSARPHSAYAWPIKPFHRQHRIRGFFCDPRIGIGHSGTKEHSFHIGIDIHARNGTPVYSQANGRVLLESYRPETVSVVSDDGHTVFQYWHVVKLVHSGQRVVAYRTVIGRVAPWAHHHLHFSEVQNNVFVNPLRRGALGPYEDHTRPLVKEFRVQRGDSVIHPWQTSGRVDFVVEGYDPTPLSLPEPWRGNPVTPAVLRWRVCGGHIACTAWQMSVDFRGALPPTSAYASVYATWTRQNWMERTGLYRFYLAHGWDSTSVPNGAYRVHVAAEDTRGNLGAADFPIFVRN